VTVSPEIQAVVDSLEEVVSLLRRHGGDWGETVATRVDRYLAELSRGDVDVLGSVLADTTGGNGSIRDVSLAPDGGSSARREDWRVLADQMFSVTATTAEACRVAMRHHGLDVWR
jgi:hypothetical protein